MTTLQERVENATATLEADTAKMHDVVHGDSSTTVMTEGGPVTSLAKSIADMETEYKANTVISVANVAKHDAYNWANRDEDDPYIDGDDRSGYSAFHFSKKAESSAAAAEVALASSLYSTVETKTTDYLAVLSDDGTMFRVNTTGGPVIITIDDIVSLKDGYRIGVVRVVGYDPITLVGTSGQTINGEVSVQIISDFALLDVIADLETLTMTASGMATLSLGTASQKDAGSAAGDVPVLDVSGSLPLSVMKMFVGMTAFFQVATAPNGWLVRDGSAELVSSFPDLAAHLHSDIDNLVYTNANAPFGYRCTNPLDPSNSRDQLGLYFVLPDARGRVDRGADLSSGREPTSTVVGQAISDDIGEHTHSGSTSSTGNHRHTISF